MMFHLSILLTIMLATAVLFCRLSVSFSPYSIVVISEISQPSLYVTIAIVDCFASAVLLQGGNCRSCRAASNCPTGSTFVVGGKITP